MTTDDVPEVVMVPVRRYDINLTLDDIISPLEQTASSLIEARSVSTTDPRLAEHLQKLSELASQLKQVVNQVNQIDPTLLAPSPTERPPTA
jgi:uncharacterized protein Yka (UPF0111/DUF47 family)